jgi:hypothetical protein
VLFEGLAFEEGAFEGLAQCSDGIGKDVIQHSNRSVARWCWQTV